MIDSVAIISGTENWRENPAVRMMRATPAATTSVVISFSSSAAARNELACSRRRLISRIRMLAVPKSAAIPTSRMITRISE